MNLVIIFGPLAVGKMTVGQELEKITELKLFHNHVTIEMVLPYFEMDSPSFKKLVKSFRMQMFEEVAKNDMGLIFTYVWALDSKENCDFINSIVNVFEGEGGTVCFVELEASTDERLKRNTTANRLNCKESKNNLEASENELLDTDKNHILNTVDNEFKINNHIKINNMNLDAVTVAGIIKERFGL